MSSPVGLQIKDCAGVDLGTRICTYDTRDVIIYALAVGARSTELELVYERDLRVLPTFSLTLGLWAVWAAGALGVYNPAFTLHVGQELEMKAPLPSSGSISTSATIGAVWDKGSAALIEVQVTSDVFNAMYTIYIPGAGGFGGERGQKSKSEPMISEPSLRTSVQTSVDQGALYRLTGDLHPVHIDPAAANAAGFERPILHGLCTLGGATLAISRVTGNDPCIVEKLTARLSAPVFPGELINISGWENDGRIDFIAKNEGDTSVVSGNATFGMQVSTQR